MKEAYRIANETIEKVRERSHKQYNKRLNHSTLDVGDNVLFRNFERSIGTSKLKSYWDKEVYQVVEKKGDGPVYCIQPLSGGKLKTVHRNLLLPCSFLPISDRHEPKNEGGNGSNGNGETDADEEMLRMTEIVDETQSNRDDQPAADNLVEHSAPDSNDQSDIHIQPTTEPRDDQDDSDGDTVDQSTSDSDDQSDEDHIRRPVRERKPPLFLQYDKFGSPASVHSANNSLFVIQRNEQPQYHDRLMVRLRELKFQ